MIARSLYRSIAALLAAVVLAPVLAWAQRSLEPVTPREPIAPYNHREPLAAPRTTLPTLEYHRSDLEAQRFRLERYGDRDNLAQQRQLRILRQEIDRTDRALGR